MDCGSRGVEERKKMQRGAAPLVSSLDSHPNSFFNLFPFPNAFLFFPLSELSHYTFIHILSFLFLFFITTNTHPSFISFSFIQILIYSFSYLFINYLMLWETIFYIT